MAKSTEVNALRILKCGLFCTYYSNENDPRLAQPLRKNRAVNLNRLGIISHECFAIFRDHVNPERSKRRSQMT